jgi:hypothetical protein
LVHPQAVGVIPAIAGIAKPKSFQAHGTEAALAQRAIRATPDVTTRNEHVDQKSAIRNRGLKALKKKKSKKELAATQTEPCAQNAGDQEMNKERKTLTPLRTARCQTNPQSLHRMTGSFKNSILSGTG